MRLLTLGTLVMVTLSTTNPAAAQTDDWYVFSPTNDHAKPSAIGMENWNDEAAGAHGRIETRGDKLYYQGQPIKLWGLNNTYAACAPDKAMADKRATLYRKFGVNAIRFHKYADGPGWAGIQSGDSFLNLDPEGLDRMDYYVHTLKQHGIYTKLSPTFGVKFGKGDFARVPFHAEAGQMRNGRIRAGHGMVFLAKELQDLQIEQTIKVLNHRNPYTKMRYADDPAIFCVELFNEDSVLFYGTNSRLQASPTIRNRVAGQFSAWLSRKYGSDEAWRRAWGDSVVISDPKKITDDSLSNLIKPGEVKGEFTAESLSKATVVPWGSPWFYDAAMNPESEQAPLKQRMLDTMAFLIGLQNDFYGRFVKAIRDTGFKGEIVASNWQAGSLVGHYLNLHSDYLVGVVDRHNYFGGGRGAMNGRRPFKNGSMLARPGMGSLSAGFQQVEGRPFMLSEWIHVQPNEWYAEGPAVMGAYGWGLQGWDVSYIFQNTDSGEFSPALGGHSWDVTNPAVLAVYATISRQVRRMDVVEAPNTKYLNVHIPSLKQGKMSFQNRTTQAWDEKSFTTDKVPMEALAATRVAVRFTDAFQPTPAIDLERYIDGRTVVSETGQLRWTPAEGDDATSGYFIMDTPGTKAFVGFAPGGKTFDLGDGYAITPGKGFAVIHLSAKDPNQTLASADEIVVTAMARVRNTGMKFNDEGNRVVARGKAPLRAEPVRARITVPFNGTLDVLDQDGIEATATRKIAGSLEIDGATDKTPFYRIRK